MQCFSRSSWSSVQRLEVVSAWRQVGSNTQLSSAYFLESFFRTLSSESGSHYVVKSSLELLESISAFQVLELKVCVSTSGFRAPYKPIPVGIRIRGKIFHLIFFVTSILHGRWDALANTGAYLASLETWVWSLEPREMELRELSPQFSDFHIYALAITY